MRVEDDPNREAMEYTVWQQAGILLLCLLVGVPLLWLAACLILSGEGQQ